MTLTIIPKKQFTDYTESEQQAILSRGQAILSQKLEQGESRTIEDTWCMLVYQRTQREVKFKPTVEKILKEKPLTKAQKIELLEESISLKEEDLTDKHKLVIEELVGKDKEYWLFTLLDGSKELMKLTKTNVKKKVKELQVKAVSPTFSEHQSNLCIGLDVQQDVSKLTESEQEFLTAMEVTK
jgi:hypothetical protein